MGMLSLWGAYQFQYRYQMATARQETIWLAWFNVLSSESTLISMLTYDGISTLGKVLDSKSQQLLGGEHFGFNVDLRWYWHIRK